MSYTIDKVLLNENIDKFQKNLETFSIWLKGISSIEIEFAILYSPSNGQYMFHQSHYIKTPTQMGAYKPSAPYADDLVYTLHKAVESIISEYQIAIKNGYSPDANWLIKNPNFNF